MRLIAALIVTLLPLSAAAQGAPTLLQTYNDWEAYRFQSNGQTMCYLLSKPRSLQPSRVNHGDVFFFLTSRPAENVSAEISVLVGYPFAPDSTVEVDVDGQKFQLFTKDDGAWVDNAAEEAQILAAMKAGSSMVVRGKSARGTDTEYNFSLAGVTAGTNRIATGCSS